MSAKKDNYIRDNDAIENAVRELIGRIVRGPNGMLAEEWQHYLLSEWDNARGSYWFKGRE